MFRIALIRLLTAGALVCVGAAASADGFDSLINLELAFRDTILDQPAPNRYQTLIRDGETTITFVSDLPRAIGKTDFHLNLDWTYDYRYTTRTVGGNTEVSVTPVNVQLKPQLRHLIRLPLAWYRDDVWESRLLGHEFDHVAISLDPRPRALLTHLCQELPAYRFSIPGAARKPEDGQIRDGINRDIQRRSAAVLELLRANYAALDQASQNGRLAMRERSDFFNRLYTAANLEAAKFPYQQQVAALLASESYRHLRPRHVPTDPTSLSRR